MWLGNLHTCKKRMQWHKNALTNYIMHSVFNFLFLTARPHSYYIEIFFFSLHHFDYRYIYSVVWWFPSQWRIHAGHGTEAPTHGLHSPPDPRAGERVPLQPLPDASASHRDRAQPVPLRAANKNLVPEPAHEVEEGQQVAQHEERAQEDEPGRRDDDGHGSAHHDGAAVHQQHDVERYYSQWQLAVVQSAQV